MLKNIGTGLMNFSEFIDNNCYYVDKTDAIKKIINDGKKTILFTRPRRFGKTLFQSTLQKFFCLNYDKDPKYQEHLSEIFSGLKIASDQEFCKKHMGQYPVIFVSFKSLEQNVFDDMRQELIRSIESLYRNFLFLIENSSANHYYVQEFRKYLNINSSATRVIADNLITSSLIFLCEFLYKTYKKQVIVLIDEYDVPVQKGHSFGFYEKIISFIRAMLYPVVKDDQGLISRCVITGCNRISKESIFTGMNSAVVYSMISHNYSDLFGFTQDEVSKLLDYYHLSDKKETVKQWYNGYLFGESYIYNPWDVMSFCDDALNGAKEPGNYWSNTSSNDIIKEFIDYADGDSLEKMQKLLNRETVNVEIDEQIVFSDLAKEHSQCQLFSVLFTSGYLTLVKKVGGEYQLKLPNNEIALLFKQLVTNFYKSSDTLFHASAQKLPSLLASGYAGPVSQLLNQLLSRYLSVRDTGAEIAYHTFLLGILSQVLPSSSLLNSELEAGNGYADLVLSVNESTGIILELKKAPSKKDLKKCSELALSQIEKRNYVEIFSNYPVKKVIVYGIAFFGKQCNVQSDSLAIRLE